MSTNIFNIGKVNTINNNDVTIHTSSANVAEVVKAFMSDRAEDIQAEDVRSNEDKPESFPLLTEQCRKEGKIEKVEAELNTACKGSAAWLWSVIHTNEALGYIATNHLDAQDVYNAFTDYFGELPYNVRNFRGARNKK